MSSYNMRVAANDYCLRYGEKKQQPTDIGFKSFAHYYLQIFLCVFSENGDK